mmetsp:Transcript_33712/g.86450  ORF Transcript_33712/g.86450 Transcript_33712/m.86450 type:complete len:97 (+) Transcript_33712:469-759(+)|eukprot:CAMPEP_0113896300 /NCGR_PEP_ID=MMETSP0780_2-20120614/17928_1 /TAXON_ID=652834 /ORGANISM="Palpitomonas bilix" /LENGTH=96 /DNA_ID=CAMNT_0000887399 /DNA_START=222 /DNA_END=512 /DNA_ORIENTATION=+ /assembly_acc=CAM_ASM_000599
MSESLQKLVGKKVNVLTNDGKVIVGFLKGFDHITNVILTECEERVYSEDAGVEVEALGLYVIRGDNVAVVGEIDPVLDEQLNLDETCAAPLGPIVH